MSADTSADRRRELVRRRMAERDLLRSGTGATGPAPDRTGQPLPLTPEQRRMWSVQQLDPSTVAYNVFIAVDLDTALDPEALRAALTEVVGRHEILRTVYRTGDDGPVQVVLDGPAPRYDWCDADPDEVDALATEVARHVFDLTAEPPLRVRSIRTGPSTSTLVVVAHHICWDDGTTAVFVRELTAAYRRIVDGGAESRAAAPGAPVLQYLDVARNRPEPSEDDVAHWARELRPLPEPVDLPALGGRASSATGAGTEQARRLHPGSGRRVRELAREHGASSFMVLFAALSALVHRYTGANDLLVGAPVVNRDVAGADEVMGYLGNTVPLRARVDGRESFAALLARCRQTCLDGYAHQHVELERIVRAADPDRDRGDRPLFTLVLSLRTSVADAFAAAGFRASKRHLSNDSARFDLTLSVEVGGDELTLEANHPAGERAEAVVALLLEHLDTLLGAALDRPDTPVDELALLGERERRRVTVDWNDTASGTTGPLLPDAFRDQARRTPEATAVVAGGRTLSYADLDERSDRLAGELVARGIGPEDVVALAVPRTPELVTAVLGVLKAGAAYLPVDPSYPPARVRLMLTDPDPRLLVSTPDVVIDVPAGLPVLDVDAGVARPGPVEPVRPLHPQHPAYVIYTSGSTGVPKGVVVPHDALRSHLAWAVREFPGLAGHTLLHSSMSFDFSVTPMFGPLLLGGVLELCEDTLDGITGAAGSATFLKVTPSHLPLLGSVRFADAGERTLVIAGEELRGAALADWRPPPGPFAVINEYGPTEATVGCLIHRLGDLDRLGTGPVPVGAPVPDVTCHVLDARLNPVPVGVLGELYVGGAQLARGYLGRPGLTASRFVASPSGDGERLYRTGDLVRWLPDGVIEYVGRSDEQVKLHGFRVELGEVEATLASHPSVGRAVATVRTDGPSGATLVGYVTVVPGRPTLDVEEMRAHVARALPDHQVPATVVVLDEIPLSPSGKADRRALPAPPVAAEGGDDGREPASEAERLLCELFAEVLGRDRVGPDDSFFELGGDSIVAIKLAARARAAGLSISPGDLFARRTPAAVAAELAPVASGAAGHADGTGRVTPTPIMRSFAERGVLGDRHRMSALLRTPAGLTVSALTTVLQAVLDRHDMLRARIGPDLTIDVPPPGAVPADAVLTRAEDAASVDDELERAAGRLRPSDGSMVRAVWFDRHDDGGDEPGRLLLVIHHLVVDGVSWRVLTRDLAEAWRQVRDGRSVELDPVPTSFRGWSEALTAQVPRRAAEREHWSSVLDGPDPAPGDRPLDPVRDTWSTVRTETVRVSTATTSAVLGPVPEALRGGVDDVLLAAFAVAVVTWRARRGAAEPSVLVTREGHGREEALADDADLSRTVGWFTSQHPVRLDLSGVAPDDALHGGPAAAGAVTRVRDHLRAVPDRGVGYGLLRHLGGELPAGREPAFGFNYLGRFDLAGSEDGDGNWEIVPGGLSAAYDPAMPAASSLVVNALTESGPDGPVLTAHWMFPSGVVDAARVRELAHLWCTALDGVAEHVRNGGVAALTRADVPLVSLDQSQLDTLAARWTR